MVYKAILFDMDGVLAMSEPVHLQAWKMVLNEIGSRMKLQEQEIIGITDLSLAKEIKKQTDTQISENELCDKKKEYFLELLRKGLPSLPGRDNFLKIFHNHTEMAVVSSSTREEISVLLNACHIEEYFRFYLGFEDTILHKPNPEPYLKAMKLLNRTPGEVLVIEDSPSGIEAAINSGASVIGMDSSGILGEYEHIPIFRDFYEIAKWLGISIYN